MKKINILAILSALILTAFMAACAEDHAIENSQEQQPQKVGTTFIGTNSIKLADNPATRTSIDYKFGENNFKFFWEPGDVVWDYNKFDYFTSNITERTGIATFTSSRQYTDEEILLSYSGPFSGAPYSVIFSGEFTQSEPNNTKHLSSGGDCGIGKAKKRSNGTYRFTIEHRSAYLCLLPRTPNGLTSTVITKVTIISDNAIIGYSGLQADGSLSPLAGGTGQDLTKQVINLGSSGQGFPLNNAQTSQETNAIYSVIYPGTHALTIEYTLKDTHTNVETTVTKTIPSQNYEPNTLTPITANLTLPTLNLKYYMWDAKKGHDVTYGHLDADGNYDKNYPRDNTDPRWFHENPGGVAGPLAATESCENYPNVNELFWYYLKGDAHWEDNAGVQVMNGYLEEIKGLWLRKKSVILAYLKANGYPATLTENDLKNSYKDTPTATPIDYRITCSPAVNPSITPTPGRPANTADYFFLPAAGGYSIWGGGFLDMFGTYGWYWSSSACPNNINYAYNLTFSSSTVIVFYQNNRTSGYPERPFE